LRSSGSVVIHIKQRSQNKNQTFKMRKKGNCYFNGLSMVPVRVKSWSINCPQDTTKVVAAWSLRVSSICTSDVTERAPGNGRPP
jgi:hypothetical protein